MSKNSQKVSKHTKSHNAEKTGRGDPLEFFNIHSVAKHQNIEEGPIAGIFFESRTMPKKTDRGPFSLVQYCVTRKKGNTFLILFARPNGAS